MKNLADWTEASENDVILAAQVGDDRAFTELYNRYQRRVAGFFVHRGVLYEDVDDCCQIVWMNIAKHLPRFDTQKSFGTWVFTCCLNRFRNYLREIRKHGGVMGIEDFNDTSWLVDPMPTPDEQVEITEQLERVESRLSETPDHPGVEALILWSQGYSYAEIAERQEVKDTAVKMRVHHMRKKLAAL